MSIRARLKSIFKRGGRHIGKVRHGRLRTAEDAIRRMKDKGVTDMTPYFCMVCQGYHIGHTPRAFKLTVTRNK